MPKRDERRSRGASLTDLLAEATGGSADALGEANEPDRASPGTPQRTPAPGRGRGGGGRGTAGTGHVRESDGSYVRVDGERRVSLQLKMNPDDKRKLKVQAAGAGLSPAEYVARLVREAGRR